MLPYKFKRKLSNILRYTLALPKTLVFNFRYFKLGTALRLPVFVSHKTHLEHLGGRVELGVVKTGIVRIGFGSVAIIDFKSRRTVLKIDGTIKFRGKAKIGMGSAVSVTGSLDLGDNFQISAASEIVCGHDIRFGNNTLLSWDILVMDTDFHPIIDNETGNQINPDKSIAIGDHVWIGARSTILKGCTVPPNTVVAAGTTLTSSSFEDPHTIIGGTPPRVLKTNIQWVD